MEITVKDGHSNGDGRATRRIARTPNLHGFLFFFSLVLTGLHLNCHGRKQRITGDKGGFRNGRTGRTKAAVAGPATWE